MTKWTRNDHGALVRAPQTVTERKRARRDRAKTRQLKMVVKSPPSSVATPTTEKRTSFVNPYLTVGDRVMLRRISLGRHERLLYGGCLGTVTATRTSHGQTVVRVMLDRKTNYGQTHICLWRALDTVDFLAPGQRQLPRKIDDRPEHWSAYATIYG